MHPLVLALFLASPAPAQPAHEIEASQARAMLRAARRHAQKAEARLELLRAIAGEQYLAGDAPGAAETSAEVEAALKDEPCDLAEARAGLAEARWDAGLRAQAEATMKEALEAGRKAARDKRARCLEPLVLLQGRLGDLAAVEATIAEMPGARKGELFPKVSELLAAQGRYDEAVALSDKADPMYGDRGIYQALYLQAAYGDWRKAAAEFKRIFEKNAGDLLARAAVEAADSGDFARADEIAAASGTLEPYPASQIVLARARHGDIDGAVSRAASALKGDPGRHAITLIGVADIAEGAGKPEEAARLLGTAMQTSAKAPEHGGHANRRLLILARQGKMDEALRDAKGSADWLVEQLSRSGRVKEAARAAALLSDDHSDRINNERALDALLEAQIRDEDIDGARATMRRLGSAVYASLQLRPQIAAALARRGRPLDALAFVQEDPGFQQAELVGLIAQEEARTADFTWAPDWLGRLKTADEKARACLGVARGRRLKRGG